MRQTKRNQQDTIRITADGIVAIIGIGPVGLVLAIDLARQGIRPVLIDCKPELHWTSRATCISRRSQEIFKRIGIVPEFFEKALPWCQGRTFHRRDPVFTLDMAFDPARDAFAPFVVTFSSSTPKTTCSRPRNFSLH